MINNTFCIYQNDYNNTVLGDLMYNLTDSAFFCFEKGAICQIAPFYLTHNLFLYKKCQF